MARGQRSNKGGQGVATKRPGNESNNKTTDEDFTQEKSIPTNNKSGGPRTRNKPKNAGVSNSPKITHFYAYSIHLNTGQVWFSMVQTCVVFVWWSINVSFMV